MMPFFEASGTHSPTEMQVFFVPLQGHQTQELLVFMFAFQNKPMSTHAAITEAHFTCMRCCMALCCTLVQDF